MLLWGNVLVQVSQEMAWTEIISASFSSQSREVIILIHKSIPYQILQTICDPAGRHIIIRGTLLSEHLNLFNVYGPNEDDFKLFNNLFLNLSALPGNHIVAGDFNCPSDYIKDFTPGSSISLTPNLEKTYSIL